MEEGWKEVFVTDSEYKMQIAKDILENAGIKVVVMNKRDTAYKIFGDICIYVAKENEANSVTLLKELKGE